MDLIQISQRRRFLGKVGAALCTLLFLAVLDGLIAQFRQGPNLLKVLPGETVEIDGPVRGEIKDLQELEYNSNTKNLTLSVQALHKGYFMGGDMWRGQLTAGRSLAPGEYRLTVSIRGTPPEQAPPPFDVLVYADVQARLRSSPSLIQRHTGYSSWFVAAAFLPLILLVFGLVFLLSQRREALLRQQGQAEIYRMVRDETGWTIRFGLGTDQGLTPGERLAILDEEGRNVGAAEVKEVGETDSWAVVSGDQEVKIGYLVSRR
ncbi:MAG: hypothetical protein ACYDIC_05660 [Desulfobaccales bacterium]